MANATTLIRCPHCDGVYHAPTRLVIHRARRCPGPIGCRDCCPDNWRTDLLDKPKP